MADSPAYPDSIDDPEDGSGLEPPHEEPPRTPRWVKVFGIIAVALILAAAAQLIFGIRHGPSMHSLFVHLW